MIVDDEPLIREELAELLLAHDDMRLVCEAATLDGARSKLSKNRIDLLLLDIELRGGTGFDLLPAIDPQTHIVFITAYDQYAVRAFEINALDYVLKPVSKERLAESLDRFRNRAHSLEKQPEDDQQATTPAEQSFTAEDKILLNHDGGRRFVNIDDIVSVMSIGGNYTEIFLADSASPLAVRETVKVWEQILPASLFCRIHRQAIVNLNRIQKTDQHEGTQRVYLAGHTEPLLVSRRMQSHFQKQLKRLKLDSGLT